MQQEACDCCELLQKWLKSQVRRAANEFTTIECTLMLTLTNVANLGSGVCVKLEAILPVTYVV